MRTYSAQDYLRHARRFGTELVYETATQEQLPPTELADLLVGLSRLPDVKFRAPVRERERLACLLAAEGSSRAEIALRLGVSKQAVSQLLAEVSDSAKAA